MRRLALLALFAACDTDVVDMTDASLEPLVCSPAATAAPPADGDGTPPLGTFAASWQCVAGCDAEPPPVITHATSLTITQTTRPSGFVDGKVEWKIESEPLYSISLEVRDGCWYRHAAFGECQSDWRICDRLGVVNIAHISIRDHESGVEQVWRMN